MSRSIKHEKTTGFLEHAGKIRKARQLARDLKADLINVDIDWDSDTHLAQFAQS